VTTTTTTTTSRPDDDDDDDCYYLDGRLMAQTMNVRAVVVV